MDSSAQAEMQAARLAVPQVGPAAASRTGELMMAPAVRVGALRVAELVRTQAAPAASQPADPAVEMADGMACS